MENFHEIIWTNDKVSKLWRYYSLNPSYNNQYFSYHSGRYILDYIRRFIDLRNKNVFDFGCGPGYLIEYLLKFFRVKKVYALDFSEEAINQVNRKFNGNKRFGKAVCVKEFPSDFSDATMDLVISVEVIEHLSDNQLLEMLKEIYRLLKPNGYIFITTPNKEDLEANKTICPECGCIFHRWQHITTWDKISLKRRMEDAGFITQHIAETIFTHPLRKLFFTLKRFFKEKLIYPHLIYIGKK